MNGNWSGGPSGPGWGDPDRQLEASLRRIKGVLQQNRHQYAAIVEQIMADTGAEVAERVRARIAEKHQRRMEQWRRRAERRADKAERRVEKGARQRNVAPDVPRAIVSIVVAVACAAIAVANPELWWLVFVAFGFGMSGASSLGHAGRRPAEERQAPAETSQTVGAAEPARDKVAEEEPPSPTPPPDPRVARIQGLCDKLLAEIESGPPIVREVVAHPQETIGGLRQACLEIARRERELRDVLASQDDAALVGERDALVARIANEQDEIVRDRLAQALRALEQQLAHRAELGTAATRLEAENTRILYTLESLHMQILRARSTDIGAPELGGKLRESLRELGTEIDAVADALEWASAPGGTTKGTIAAPASQSPPTPATGDAQRAEREAAARRAAQAREAQRG